MNKINYNKFIKKTNNNLFLNLCVLLLFILILGVFLIFKYNNKNIKNKNNEENQDNNQDTNQDNNQDNDKNENNDDKFNIKNNILEKKNTSNDNLNNNTLNDMYLNDDYYENYSTFD